MTATQSFKIQSILEKAVGREKATEFTEQIDEVVSDNTKALKEVFATKIDIERLRSGIRKDIFIASAVQYIVTVGSILGILSFIFQYYNPK